MTATRKSNLRFIMKQAHELCKSTIQEGDDYRITLGLCISTISKRMKNIQKPVKKAYNYMGGRCSDGQYKLLKAWKESQGLKMKLKQDQISAAQAKIWIDRYCG